MFVSSIAYLASCSAALCQSAEETAAFIIAGAEDGAKIMKDGNVAATLTQRASSPATFVLHSSTDQTLGEISVKEIEKCQFQLTATKTSEPPKSFTYDFNKLATVSFAMGYGYLTFAGTCAVQGYGSGCMSATTTAQWFDAPVERVMKALNYMKSTYCRGSAF